MTARAPDPAELAEDLDEIKKRLAGIDEKLDARYVPRELYEARHTALRSEIALEMAAIKARQDADRTAAEKADTETRHRAESARGLSMWALGLLCTAVVVAMVGWLVSSAGGGA